VAITKSTTGTERPTIPAADVPIVANFSYEMWVRFDVSSGIERVIHNYTGGKGTSIYRSGGSIYASVGYGAGNVQTAYVWAPTLGQWYHMAAVFESGVSIKHYIDGVLVDEKTTVNTWALGVASYNLGFGMHGDGSTGPLRGAFAGIHWYERLLSASEINDSYQSGGAIHNPDSCVVNMSCHGVDGATFSTTTGDHGVVMSKQGTGTLVYEACPYPRSA